MYATEAKLVVCILLCLLGGIYDDHALVLKLLNALLDHIAKLYGFVMKRVILFHTIAVT